MEVPPALRSSDVVIVVSQKKMVANVEPSDIDLHDLPTYTGGGLIPALIPIVVDAAVETSNSAVTRENLGPIQKGLANYDVGSPYKTSFSSRVRNDFLVACETGKDAVW